MGKKTTSNRVIDRREHEELLVMLAEIRGSDPAAYESARRQILDLARKSAEARQ